MKEVVIVGSGPNGLSAAIYLQQKGVQTYIYECNDTPGGGMRTQELTLPGFRHDVCSAIHPLAYDSPFFKNLPLEKFGLDWIIPENALAHPMQNGEAITLNRSIQKTSEQLGPDLKNWENTFKPFTENWEQIQDDILGPAKFPNHLSKTLRFGLSAFKSASSINSQFISDITKTLFAGLAAHSILPLKNIGTAGFGLVLGILGHINGWPFPKGGTQTLTNTLCKYYESIGGIITTGAEVTDISQFEDKIILLDLTPKQVLELKGIDLSGKYTKRYANFKTGPGVFKMDWALSEPVPWANEKCSTAGTVHLGGSYEEIKKSEYKAWHHEHAEKPFVLLAQPSLFDNTRAPEGKHTLWGYCHVPNGSDKDMTASIENQIERYAPGFKDTILSRSSMSTRDMETYNPNYIGGDINGGHQGITQMFHRPFFFSPYRTSSPEVYICSSSTPPGGGVHGMCGYHAAKQAYKDHFS